MKPVLGIIGGSGLYEMAGLEDVRWEAVETPWGKPSDELCRGRLHGIEVVFLPRHGRGHVIPPSHINYRANIDALKRAGVTDLLSFFACGSLREEIAPGEFVMFDQYIDRTYERAASFFSAGLAVHVSMADPVSPRLAGLAAEAAVDAGVRHHKRGVYLAMEGPHFSARAESRLYRSWGCDVIGMTGMPEAKLAREAEIPFAGVAMVTDYDSWRSEGAAVDVPEVLRIMAENSEKAIAVIEGVAARLARGRAADATDTALQFAVITAPEKRDAALMKKCEAILARVLSAGASS